MRHIGIIGAGQMGTGIAQVAASISKVTVSLYDQSSAAVQQSMAFIDRMMQKDVNKGKLQLEDKQRAMQAISPVTSLEQLKDVDMIIEAVKEDPEMKCKLFGQLSTIVTRPETIFASNTSSISITRLAAATNRPDRVIGMHFMNPVPVMQLVEIIKGLATSEETLETTVKLAKAMSKTPTLSRDVPGFIANRCLMPYINEAVFALYEGIGTAQDIDTTMKLGCNMPMGPLQLADFIGLDTCLAVLQVLHTQLGDPKYRPCPLLIQYVQAGWLGKKTGRGFYGRSEPEK